MKKAYTKTAFIFYFICTFLTYGNYVFASEIFGTINTIENSVTIPDSTFAIPVANPNSGTFVSDQRVILSASGSLNIRYTIDGSIPSCTVLNNTSLAYSEPILIDKNIILQAIACYPDNKTSSGFLYAVYTINIPDIVTPPPTSGSSGGGSSSGSSSSGGGGGGGGSSSSSSSNRNTTAGKTDTNNDGKINILDFVILMANWGKIGASNTADFNGDGKVDILDFVKLMADWSK